jgi:hypothetical protein
MRDKLTRRSTLKLLVAVPLCAAVVSACGKKTEPDSCQDTAGLNDADKATRTTLQYNDRSPEKDRHCAVCTYWQAPKDVAQCGLSQRRTTAAVTTCRAACQHQVVASVCQGPSMATVRLASWMFTNKILPSGEKHTPANSL